MNLSFIPTMMFKIMRADYFTYLHFVLRKIHIAYKNPFYISLKHKHDTAILFPPFNRISILLTRHVWKLNFTDVVINWITDEDRD